MLLRHCWHFLVFSGFSHLVAFQSSRRFFEDTRPFKSSRLCSFIPMTCMVKVIVSKDSWMCGILSQSMSDKLWLIKEIVLFFSFFLKHTSQAVLNMWMNRTLVQKWKWLYNVWGKPEAEGGSQATSPSIPGHAVSTLIMLNKNQEAWEEFLESSFLYNTLPVPHSPLLKNVGVRGWPGKINSS